MKYLLILISLLFSFLEGAEKYPNSRKMTQIVSAQSKALAAKHHLNMVGFGTEGPGETKGYILQYEIIKDINIDEAREILVCFVDELVASIEKQAQKKKIPKEPPNFNALFVSISFKDLAHRFQLHDDFLTYACLSKGKVHFSIGIPGTYDLKTIHSEPYEQAYRIVLGG